MTGDDIRRLIGSYATGSLTEAERNALYEAALEDQELFDELAREHSFKQLLEEPGAKQRLIAALSRPEPEPGPGAKAHGWRWATAALIATSVLIAILAGRNGLRPPVKPPVKIARIMSDARQVPPEAPAPVPAASPKMLAPQTPEKQAPSRKKVPKEEKDERDEAAKPVGQLAAPAPSQFVSTGSQSAAAVGGVVAPRAAAASFKAALMRAPRFAFDYEVETGGTLMIKSATVGYLRVAANSPAGTQVIFPSTGTGRVDIDSVNRVPIPAGTQELVITLSGQPASDAAPGLSSSSENSSGTVEDPNPSVNSKLVLTLRVHY